MNLDHFIVGDADSGTFMGAANVVLLDTRHLSKEEQRILNESSEELRSDLLSRYGMYLERLITDEAYEEALANLPVDEPPFKDFSASQLGL